MTGLRARLAAIAAVWLALLCVPSASSAAVALRVTLHEVEESALLIGITNLSEDAIPLVGLEVTVDGRRYDASFPATMPARQGAGVPVRIARPALDGSYVVTMVVRHRAEGREGSVLAVDVADFGPPARIDPACEAPPVALWREGTIQVTAAGGRDLDLVVPGSLEVVDASALGGRHIFRVRAERPDARRSVRYYGVTEGAEGGRHRAGICQGRVDVGPDAEPHGLVPARALLVQVGLCLVVVGWLSRRSPGGAEGRGPGADATLKWLSRFALVGVGYLVVQDLDDVVEMTRPWVAWEPYQVSLDVVVAHLRGEYFTRALESVIDPFWLAVGLAGWPWMRRFDEGPADGDKYVAFVSAIMAPFDRSRRTELAKLGLGVFAVKLFFLPLSAGWVLVHVTGLPVQLARLELDFLSICDFVMRICFLVETSVFAFGYLVESRKLDSEIRSVEPTVLGWLVCLWCYPPFGQAFLLFDSAQWDLTASVSPVAHQVVVAIVLGLWLVYTAAAVSLGAKASNLTNRGIVRRGPYGWVRHPAYAAKLSIWTFDWIFSGKVSPGMWASFVVVYVLRAWTEERHLMRDPDYRAYREEVRHWFIPGVL